MPATPWTWRSPAAVVAACALTELLVWTLLREADPEGPRLVVAAIPLLAVGYAAFAAGLLGGLVGSGILVVYAFYFFAMHGVPEAAFLGGEFFRRAIVLSIVAVGLGTSVGALKDRDARREARAHHELEAKNKELARANEDLRQANRALEAFTYVVSHDLKEPVRALVAYSREMEEQHKEQIPPPARELAERTRAASERLAHLLQGLLDYARVARISTADFRVVDLKEVLELSDCLGRYASALKEGNATLTVVPGARLRAARAPLCVALGNLILNSARHHPGSGVRITIASRTLPEDPSRVAVTVEDNGAGFPADVLESFREGGKSLRRGFGLTIAREAIEKMGGTMTLGKGANGGAQVLIVLPAAT